MINFPASPIINQIHSYNGLSWRFDGTSWVSLHPSGFQGAFFRHKVILQEESNHFEIGIPSFNVATDQIFVYAGGIYQNIPQEIVVTATTIEKVVGTWPTEADFDILVIKQDESSTGGSSINYFTDIFDVPKSYTGMAGKAVVVKATEDGLEFGNVASNESGELTSYVRAALDLTETMANASGFYTTTTENPDGSMTVYYHNNPLLSYSTIVYMRSAEGFVWTDNYQGSLTVWNAGYTANGNMVIKTLSALGINADWINAGKINAAHISIGSNTTFADGYNPATAIANAQAAQKAAEIAKSEALSATQEANSAAWNAQFALDELAQISADNMITASEKQALKKEWDVIVSEKPIIDAQAVKFSIVTEKATYGTKYNALDVYLNQDFTIFGDLTVTSQIFSGEDLRLVFTEYYDARTALLNTIIMAAKTVADTAQSAVTTLQNSLGNLAYTDMVEKALLGSTVISGGFIKSDLLTADNIVTGAIKSSNYAYTSGNFNDAGTIFDLTTGLIRSKNFVIDRFGNAKFKSGVLGGFTLTETAITAADLTITTDGAIGVTPELGSVSFNVSSFGKLTAKGAAFTGLTTIEAYTVKVGNLDGSRCEISANGTITLFGSGSVNISEGTFRCGDDKYYCTIGSMGQITTTYTLNVGRTFKVGDASNYCTISSIGTITTTGGATIAGTFKVGDASDYCNISSTGAINTTSSITASGAISTSGTLTASGNATLNGTTNTIANALKHTGNTLGFFNATPKIKTTVLAPSAITTTGTADATYSSNEQTMLGNLKTDVTNLRSKLNEIWSALDGYGMV